MTFNLRNIPRTEKRDILTQIRDNLALRAQNGPAEPVLDAFLIECSDLAGALGSFVEAHTTANAERTAKLALLAKIDTKVDTLYRHIHGYLDVEARAEGSAHADDVRALLQTAFPDGLERINDAIGDENRYCRTALAVLRSTDYASILQAIDFPLAWLNAWDAALTQSEATLLEVNNARNEKHQNISAGQDAEAEWVELMSRLRKYMASRASRADTEKVKEGETLLAPLLNAMAKHKAMAASRATRKEKGKEESNPETTG